MILRNFTLIAVTWRSMEGGLVWTLTGSRIQDWTPSDGADASVTNFSHRPINPWQGFRHSLLSWARSSSWDQPFLLLDGKGACGDWQLVLLGICSRWILYHGRLMAQLKKSDYKTSSGETVTFSFAGPWFYLPYVQLAIDLHKESESLQPSFPQKLFRIHRNLSYNFWKAHSSDPFKVFVTFLCSSIYSNTPLKMRSIIAFALLPVIALANPLHISIQSGPSIQMGQCVDGDVHCGSYLMDYEGGPKSHCTIKIPVSSCSQHDQSFFPCWMNASCSRVYK